MASRRNIDTTDDTTTDAPVPAVSSEEAARQARIQRDTRRVELRIRRITIMEELEKIGEEIDRLNALD